MLVVMIAIIAVTSMTFIYFSRKEIQRTIITAEETWARNVLGLVILDIEHSYNRLCHYSKSDLISYDNYQEASPVRQERIDNFFKNFPDCPIRKENLVHHLNMILGELRTSFNAIRIAETGYLFLFNEDKKMLIHPGMNSYGDNAGTKVPEKPEVLEELIRAERTPKKSFEYLGDKPGYEGNYSFRKICYVAYFESLGWYVGAAVYRDETRKSTEGLRKNILILSIGFFAMGIVLALLYANTLSVPIRELAWAMEKIKEEGLEAAKVPVSGTRETRALGGMFNEMLSHLRQTDALNVRLYQDLENYNKTLEFKVSERTRALNNTLRKVEDANQKIMESIRYAKMIQSSLLPNPETVKMYIPRSFFIWRPRDVVGGDIFYVDAVGKGFVVAVIDCTGHGVPGAFMTMIASSALRQIVKDEACYDPAEILKRLNFIVKTTLQQDTDYAASDDGMDAGICSVSAPDGTGGRMLIFAGARMPLYYVQDNRLNTIRGDRHSIGYKASRKSDMDFNFTNHIIEVRRGMCFYMATDGFTDQLGGEKERRFGTQRFRKLIQENYHRRYDEQRVRFLLAFNEHRGKNEVQDDMTVVGFGA